MTHYLCMAYSYAINKNNGNLYLPILNSVGTLQNKVKKLAQSSTGFPWQVGVNLKLEIFCWRKHQIRSFRLVLASFPTSGKIAL